MSIPTAPDDIDELWLNMRKDISTPVVVKHQKRSLDGTFRLWLPLPRRRWAPS